MDNLNKAHDEGVVIGLHEVAGVQERLDIDVMLLTQPDTFNLFLIALMELQGKKVDWKVDTGYSFTSKDIMSWFQIAGKSFIYPLTDMCMTDHSQVYMGCQPMFGMGKRNVGRGPIKPLRKVMVVIVHTAPLPSHPGIDPTLPCLR
jgi:hypothetical protein